MNTQQSIAFVSALTVLGIGCYQFPRHNDNICLNLPDYIGGGGSGGEDIVTTSSSMGGGGATQGTGGDPDTCLVPQLSYNPGVPSGMLVPTDDTIGNIEAARLEPFGADSTCQTVIVGLSQASEPCEIPSALELMVFDSGTVMPSSMPSLFEVIPIGEDMLFQTASPGAYELRIPLVTMHLAGLYPIVGARMRSNVCPLLMPWCDPSRSLVHDASGWGEQSAGQLYFGLSDCATP